MIRTPLLHQLLHGCEVSPELLAHLEQVTTTAASRIVEEAVKQNGQRKLLHAEAVEAVLSDLFGDELTKSMLDQVLAHKHRGFTTKPRW